MSKGAAFHRKWFYWVIVLFLAIPLVANIIHLVWAWNVEKLFSVAFMGFIYYLVASRHRYAKIVLQVISVFSIVALLVEAMFFVQNNHGQALLAGLSLFGLFLVVVIGTLILSTQTITIECEEEE